MADEKMVKVDLRNSVGLRGPGAGKYAGVLYGPGKGVEVPEEVAQRLGIEGKRSRSRRAAAGADDGGDDDRDDLNTWTVDELKDEAERRGIEVERGDGGDGEPLKADYVKALQG